MNNLDDIVKGISVSNNGYIFIMDKLGYIISHPLIHRTNWPSELMSVYTAEPKISSTVWDTLISNRNTQAVLPLTINKNGELFYITWVYLNDVQQFVVALLPDQDISISAKTLYDKQSSSVIKSTIIIAVVLVFLGILLLLLLYPLSRKFTAPIRRIADNLNEINKGNINMENINASKMIELSPTKELTALTESCMSICMILQAANDSLANGDPELALKQYIKTEKLVKQFHNELGMAVTWNNQANIHYKYKKDVKYAEQLYIKALDIAIKYLNQTDCNKNRDQYNALLITCGKRSMNLGVLYKENGRRNEGKKYFEYSLQYHRNADDASGIARVSGNLGQYYISSMELKQAEQVLTEAYDTLKQSNDIISLQYTKFNLALLCEAKKEYENAIHYIEQIIWDSEYMDILLQKPCLQYLCNWYEKLGDIDSYNKVNELLESMSIRNVLFALDVSGSMAGNRIKQCREGILQVVKYLGKKDNISLIIFNRHVQEIFPLWSKYKYESIMNNYINTRTNCDGNTNFYGALEQL